MKRSEKSRKASSIDAEKRKQAEFDLGKKQPAQTWSARMPAYTYTQACPEPELREPPQRKDKIVETTKPIGVHKICLRCRKRYPLKESKCICGGWLYVTGVYRSKMRIGGGVGGETGTGGTLRKGSSKST